MARSFDPMQLGSIELFCKAAELSSFTAAAQVLGITPAAVSRSIARLEARLGARLFVRSTRQIRLTDDGRDTWTAAVDYGDGDGPQPLELHGSYFLLRHRYRQPGTYTVTVAIADDEGGVGTHSFTVVVDW